MPSVQLPKKEALIVDDDVRARELLSEFCRGQGFEVATAHDGRAAIAAITRDPAQFAVIITDLHLLAPTVSRCSGRRERPIRRSMS
jgi:CheY-like chemotaxis protein